jgi:ubiquinone/menaquinone biosynthesis C-methylase UbiE
MSEINLLKNYPKTKRDLSQALLERTDEVRLVARKFGKDFFDGDRKYGYGGHNYNPRFWTNVVKDFVNYYKLKDGSKILDVGCGKGFMLYDFLQSNKNFIVKGIDISSYAIENSMPEVKKNLEVGDAKELQFEDNSFDLVISINTIHNLERNECAKSLREIERVSKKNKFIIVDAYKDDEEKNRMFAWNLTARTIMHVEEWKFFFTNNNYTGDYYWFTP